MVMFVGDGALFRRIAGPAMMILLLLPGCERRQDSKTAEAAPSVPEYRFALVFPDHFFTCAATAAHLRWKDSLVRNIHHQGNAHVFMLTDLIVLDHGVERRRLVYQNTGKPSQFMVKRAEHSTVVIDREKSVIGTMGVDGVTTHPRPDGQMIVCLEPTPGTGILGVLLSQTDKTDAEPPLFAGRQVCWTWGPE